MKERVLILGATSGIAKELARVLAERGCSLILAGRNREELENSAADIKLRYEVAADVETFDALDPASQSDLIGRIVSRPDAIDGVVLCYGYLPDQRQSETDMAEARRTIEINFTSAVTLLAPLAEYFAQRKCGYLAVISSVAGDRGRQSNYTYRAHEGRPDRLSRRFAQSPASLGSAGAVDQAGVCRHADDPGAREPRLAAGGQLAAHSPATSIGRSAGGATCSTRPGSGGRSCSSCGCCPSGCSSG